MEKTVLVETSIIPFPDETYGVCCATPAPAVILNTLVEVFVAEIDDCLVRGHHDRSVGNLSHKLCR